jgi:hypothetical protein
MGTLLLVAILAAAALFAEVERAIIAPTDRGGGKVRATERSAVERSPASPVAGGHEVSGVGSSNPG